MGLRPEQFNIEQLLRYFRNHLLRDELLDELGDLTIDELDKLGIKFNDYLKYLKMMIKRHYNLALTGYGMPEVIEDNVNVETELNNMVYYYEDFLKKFPLQYILDLRGIKWNQYETDDSLMKKIVDSNPDETTSKGVLVSSAVYDEDGKIEVEESSFDGLSQLDKDFVYQDKKILVKIAIKELLTLRDVKWLNEKDYDWMLDKALQTNAMVNYALTIDSPYLDANSFYNYNFLVNYGLKVLSAIYGYSTNDDELENNYNEIMFEREDSPSDSDDNTNILSVDGNIQKGVYYTLNYLKLYGLKKVFELRNINDVTINNSIINNYLTRQIVEEKLLMSNPKKSEYTDLNLASLKRLVNMMRATLNYHLLTRNYSVGEEYFFSKSNNAYSGYSNLDVGTLIDTETSFAPIGVIINNIDDYKSTDDTIGKVYYNFDSSKVRIYNSGTHAGRFNYTVFYDFNCIAVGKNDETYDDAYKNIEKFMRDTQNKPVKREDNELVTTTIPFDNMEDEIYMLNGIGYNNDSEDVNFNTEDKRVEFTSSKFVDRFVVSDDNESYITNITGTYKTGYVDGYDFDNYVYSNGYITFGEEKISTITASNSTVLNTKMKIKDDLSNFILVLMPLDDDEQLVGDFIIEKIDEEKGTIRIRLTGRTKVKFRWMVLCNDYIINKQISNKTYKESKTLNFTKVDNADDILFYDVAPQFYDEFILSEQNGKFITFNESQKSTFYEYYNYEKIDPDNHDTINVNDMEVYITENARCKNFMVGLMYYPTISTKQYLEFTNGKYSNINGMFDRNEKANPSGDMLLNYSGIFNSTKLNGISGNGYSLMLVTDQDTYDDYKLVKLNTSDNFYRTDGTGDVTIGISDSNYSVGSGTYFHNSIPTLVCGITYLYIKGNGKIGSKVVDSGNYYGVVDDKSSNQQIAILLENITDNDNNINLYKVLIK
jgi:hypothetical protein